MLLWKRKLIVYGGTGFPFSQLKGDHVYIYCLNSYKWIDLSCEESSADATHDSFLNTGLCSCELERVEPCTLPVRYGHTMTLGQRNEDVYIFSGTRGHDVLEELYKFNLINLTWERINICWQHEEKVPCARFRHKGVSYGGEFFIFGGSTLVQNANIDKQNIFSFNYEQLKWIQHTCPSTCTVVVEDGQQVVQHPQPRRAHSCVVHDRTMCMVAGRNDSDEFLGDIWMFDMHEKIWRKYPHAFPYEISFHASAVTPHGCMYVRGNWFATFVQINCTKCGCVHQALRNKRGWKLFENSKRLRGWQRRV